MPVYLYAAYTNGLTVDHRMAQLLQIFEPIAHMEAQSGALTLSHPTLITYSNVCPRCGKTLTRRVKNKGLHFEDELRAVMKKYGSVIFSGDTKSRILKKAVASRNRIAHVVTAKKERRKGFTAGQCGFYIHKFTLLYRYIVLCNIGIDDNQLTSFLHDSVTRLNNHYPQLRITKT